MNYSRTLKGAALAAALLLGQTQPALADPIWKDAVIVGKVTLQDAPSDPWDGDVYLSVTIPASDKMPDNVQIWNLGDVQCGGVYDSFYNGGPGYFRVKNTGTYPAYVYVSTGYGDLRGFEYFGVGSMQELLYGISGGEGNYDIRPNPWFHQIREDEELAYMSYKLAVSTDVTAVVPAWRPLSYICYEDNYYGELRYVDGRELYYDGEIFDARNQQIVSCEGSASAYLAYMPVGETQLFDLKFWAPQGNELGDWPHESTQLFIIRIEAAAFKLWDHEQ